MLIHFWDPNNKKRWCYILSVNHTHRFLHKGCEMATASVLARVRQLDADIQKIDDILAEAPEKRTALDAIGDTNPTDQKIARVKNLREEFDQMVNVVRGFAESRKTGVVTPRQIDTLLEGIDPELYGYTVRGPTGLMSIISYFLQVADSNDLAPENTLAMLKGLLRAGAKYDAFQVGPSPVTVAVNTKWGSGLLELAESGVIVTPADIAVIKSKSHKLLDNSWRTGLSEEEVQMKKHWRNIERRVVWPLRRIAVQARALVLGDVDRPGHVDQYDFMMNTSDVPTWAWRMPNTFKGVDPGIRHVVQYLLWEFNNDYGQFGSQREFYDMRFSVIRRVIANGARVDIPGEFTPISGALGSDSDPRIVELLLNEGAPVTAELLETARYDVDIAKRSVEDEKKDARKRVAPVVDEYDPEKLTVESYIRNVESRLKRANTIYDLIWARFRPEMLELTARRTRLLREVPPEVQEMILGYTEKASQAERKV